MADNYCLYVVFFSSGVSVAQNLVVMRSAQINSLESPPFSASLTPHHPCSFRCSLIFLDASVTEDSVSLAYIICSLRPLTLNTEASGRSPRPETLLGEDKWKVLVLTRDTGTQANVTLWVYGEKEPLDLSLTKDSPEQLFLPGQKDEFQVIKISSHFIV